MVGRELASRFFEDRTRPRTTVRPSVRTLTFYVLSYAYAGYLIYTSHIVFVVLTYVFIITSREKYNNTVQDDKIRNKVDRSKSSRRVQSYSVVGTWPSAVARVMSGTRIGQWREDLLLRTDIMAERRVAKDSRHHSQPITVEYGFCCFPVIMSASRLWKVSASRPMPPVVVKTIGVKTQRSTSRTR